MIQIILSNGVIDVETKRLPIEKIRNDINDVFGKEADKSYDFDIKGTKYINNLFGNLFDVNSTYDLFNINAEVGCKLVVDNVTIIEDGRLILRSVSIDYDDVVNYKIQIIDNISSFYTKITDLELTDLDISEYNHRLTNTNIFNSYTHSWSEGYKYLLPTTQDAAYYITEFKPAINEFILLEKIFNRTGYTFEFEESHIEDKIKRSWITYNGDQIKVDEGFFEENRVVATGSNYTLNVGGTANGFNNLQATSGTGSLIVNNEVLDDSGYYNPVTGIYDNNFYSYLYNNVSYTIKVDYDVYIENNSGGVAYLYPNFGMLGGLDIRPEIIFKTQSGSQFSSISALGGYNGSIHLGTSFNDPYLTYSVGSTLIYSANGIVKTGTLHNIVPGNQIFNETRLSISQENNSSPLIFRDAANTNAPRVEVDWRLVIRNIQLEYNVNLDGVQFGTPMVMNLLLPQKMKQTEFIKNICNQFNLIIDRDETNNFNLIFKNRDEWYDNGREVDWSKKKDIGSQTTIEFLSNLNTKKTILSYKNDDNEANKTYLETVKEVYGELEWISSNNNIKGEKTCEITFAPATHTKSPFGAYVQLVDGVAPKGGVRCLYDGGIKSCGTYKISNTSSDFTEYNTYPCLTHYDDPDNPNFDYNYGVCDYYFYEQQIKTNNTLFNLYWRRTYGQLNSGRLMTAYLQLNSWDVYNIRLNDKIWFRNSWWHINKMLYDPAQEGLTKIEFISVDENIRFTPFITRLVRKPVLWNGVVARVIRNIELNKGDYKNSYSGVPVNINFQGDGNWFGEYKNISGFGDNNFIDADNVVVYGDGKYITESNSMTIDLKSYFEQETTFNGPVIINGTFSLNGFTISNIWIDTGGGQIKINAPYASYDVIPANDYATNLGYIGNHWNNLYMGSQIYATGSYLDFYSNTTPVFGINSTGIYTYTGKVIKSDNGGGQLELDAFGNPDEVFLSTDNGGGAESYLYMTPTSNGLAAPSDVTLAVAGSVELYLTETQVDLGTASNSSFRILDNGIYLADFFNSSFNAGVTNSVLIGLQGVAVTASNTLYVPNVRTYGDVYIQSGESIINASNDNMQIKFNANSLNDLFLESKSSATNYANLTLTSITSSNIHEAVLLAESSTTTVISAVGADADASSAYIGTVLSGVTQYVLSHASNGIILQGDKVLRHRRATNNEIGYDIQLATLTTTNGATTSLFSGYNIGSYDSIVCEATVLGYDSSNNNTIASKLFASFRNVAGVWTLVTSLDKSQKSSFTTADTELSTDGNTINVEVNGEAATTIQWQCNIKSSYWVT